MMCIVVLRVSLLSADVTERQYESRRILRLKGERLGKIRGTLGKTNRTSLGCKASIAKYCEVASEATGIPIPISYPVVGRDAFRTATGVHAAAVIKAFRKGDDWLVDMVYSGVPAKMFGREQVIEIGPMSGKSNITFWLERHGIEPTEERVERIFNRAKQVDCVLTDEQIMQLA